MWARCPTVTAGRGAVDGGGGGVVDAGGGRVVVVVEEVVVVSATAARSSGSAELTAWPHAESAMAAASAAARSQWARLSMCRRVAT